MLVFRGVLEQDPVTKQLFFLGEMFRIHFDRIFMRVFLGFGQRTRKMIQSFMNEPEKNIPPHKKKHYQQTISIISITSITIY